MRYDSRNTEFSSNDCVVLDENVEVRIQAQNKWLNWIIFVLFSNSETSGI